MNAPRKSGRGVLGALQAVLRLVMPMHFKYSVAGQGARAALSLIFLSTIAACGSSAGGGAGPGGSSDGGHDNGDSTTTGGDSSPATGPGDASEPSDGSRGEAGATANSDGGDAMANTDAGHDAMTTTDGGADGGVRDVGSCCSAQTTPGCSNASLEVCVCEKDQSCCTTAWGLGCALIVQQKYCQPGVRDCVCGTDAGQWGQTQCCATDWTSTCDSVATIKCGAVQGCF